MQLILMKCGRSVSVHMKPMISRIYRQFALRRIIETEEVATAVWIDKKLDSHYIVIRLHVTMHYFVNFEM